jgi:hypothetical protein
MGSEREFVALSMNSMQWPIGAGFSDSAFPLRFAVQGSALVCGYGFTA